MTSVTAITRSSTDRPPRRPGGWLVPTGLILLSLIPVLGGAFRLSELGGGAAITADNARFFAAPVPIVAHIVGATVYCLLGAFQFVPALRGRRAWHRIAGLILIPAGLIAALSGLWMAVFVTPAPGAGGTLLLALRLAFGSALAACIILGVVAIRRRDFGSHGAWMTRAYALGVAAGTQAIVFAIWIIGGGATDELTGAVLMGTAWVINAAVAELVIRRRSRGAGVARSPSHPAVP
ncbi:putative membrane protein DUF2306 [Microterricola gilva]|uniref:Putative membrane protein DUF2306 n=1 Tax=Microterricola gilva TaxID=393267 RepID=A0A4Q8ALC9_9MICO|nr:DUF2306 domain-containing protein [Microterricola gilva]RZU65347.1 putative membrane protein DUF2306 [Microterricola gilva]